MEQSVEVTKSKKILGILEYKKRYKDWNDIKVDYYEGDRLETKRKDNWKVGPLIIGLFFLGIQTIIVGIGWGAYPDHIVRGWILNLLKIGMPISTYLFILTYFLGRDIWRLNWLPFEEKTVIWTKIP
jgi:hypothetical protein